jgi:hypothetical protein
MKTKLVPALALVATSLISLSREEELTNCRFAKQYNQAILRDNKEALSDFLTRALFWESKFVREIGVDKLSGLTLDG